MTRKMNVGKVILFLGLILTISVVATPATATVYKATPANINFLHSYATWAPYGTMYGENAYLLQQGAPWKRLPVTNMKLYTVGNIRTCKVGNNAGTQYGQCIDFARAVTGTDARWTKGSKVTAGGASIGDIVSTFGSDGKYDNRHVAVFAYYTYDSKTHAINGFWVWDQNYVYPGVAGKHVLKINGKGTVSDASIYCIANV